MKKFVRTLVSTDFNSMLIKLSIFFVLMVLTLLNFYITLAAFLWILCLIIIEKSYNSLIWVILYFVCHPYAPSLFMFPLILIFLLILIIKFVEDIIKKRTEIHAFNNILILIIGFIITALFMLPLTPHYSFFMSCRESVAIMVLTIIFINHDKLDIKMLMKITAIFIALYCIVHNIIGTLELCYYRQIIYGNVNRYSLFLDDPNYTAGLVLIALISTCVLYKNKDINNWLFYSLFISLGVCLMNTVSKAGFIVYALLVIVTLIDKIIVIAKNKSRETKRELIYFILSLIAVCLLAGNATIAMLSRVFSFTAVAPENQVAELTTDRWDLILIYLKGVFDTPYEAIFGHGLAAPLLAYAPGDYRDTHCIALSLAYTLGIIVVILIICLYIISIVKAKKKLHWFNICMSGLVLLMYMSLSAHIFSQFYVFVFVFILALGLNQKSENEVELQQTKDKNDI